MLFGCQITDDTLSGWFIADVLQKTLEQSDSRRRSCQCVSCSQ